MDRTVQSFFELGLATCFVPLIIFFGAGLLIAAAYAITGEGRKGS